MLKLYTDAYSSLIVEGDLNGATDLFDWEDELNHIGLSDGSLLTATFVDGRWKFERIVEGSARFDLQPTSEEAPDDVVTLEGPTFLWLTCNGETLQPKE